MIMCSYIEYGEDSWAIAGKEFYRASVLNIWTFYPEEVNIYVQMFVVTIMIRYNTMTNNLIEMEIYITERKTMEATLLCVHVGR